MGSGATLGTLGYKRDYKSVEGREEWLGEGFLMRGELLEEMEKKGLVIGVCLWQIFLIKKTNFDFEFFLGKDLGFKLKEK